MAENHTAELDTPQTTRPTIGLLIGNTWDPLAWDIWEGVNDIALKHDVNLLYFAGDDLQTPFEHHAQANRIYELVCSENVDGVILWGGGLGQYVTPAEIQALCAQLKPLPMVNLSAPLENIPTILVDNYQGMSSILLHLIQEHNCQRIAFVKGPKDHPEAQERFRAYQDVLDEHKLPFDPNLVAPGDFNPDSGAEAVKLFIDQRKLQPGVDFDAIVLSGDIEAIKAIEVLAEKGVRVPQDVAVTGFDNAEAGWYNLPPLTTVSIRLHQQAHQAAEMILAQLAGRDAPDETVIPTWLVVRQSCGCSNPVITRSAINAESSAPPDRNPNLMEERAKIVVAILHNIKASSFGMASHRIEELIDAFLAEIMEEKADTFLHTLQALMHQVALPPQGLTAWQGTISELRRQLWPYLAGKQLDRAQDLWQQAHLVVGETIQQIQVHRRLQADRRARALHEISQSLITSFDMQELMNTIEEGLPYLGIKSVFVSLYEDPNKPTGWARLMVAFNEDGPIPLPVEGLRFRSTALAPKGLLPRNRRFCGAIEPLFFQTDQLGFALFEAEPRDAIIYDTLRGFISSALKGAMIIEQHQQMQSELRSERDFADSLLDTAPVIVLLLDKNGRISRFNSYMEEISGYSLEETKGKDWFATFVPRRERRVTKAVFSQALEGTEPYSHTTSLVNKKGSRRQIEWFHKRLQSSEGETLGLLSIGQDVTERRQAERRLAAIHSLGQELVLSQDIAQIADLVVDIGRRVLGIPVCGLWLVDDQQQSISCWALAADPGIEKAPVIPINSRQSVIAHVIRTGEVTYLADVRQDPRYLSSGFESRSELCIPFKVAGRVIGALNAESWWLEAFGPADRQLMEALANAATIAIHNARLYEETQSRAEHLVIANRNAWAANKELEAFAYSVSHDLRAPLRSINGFSQALLDDYGDQLDEEGQDYLFRMRAASLRMGHLIDGLLQLSRLTRGKLYREELDLSSMASEIAADLQGSQPKRQVEIIIEPGLTANGDARLLQVALHNLMNNAWKFTQKKETPRIEFGVQEIDGHTTYFMQDNGAGFDMSYADKLFAAFQRLHAVMEFDGTGIGLATVQRIIQRHGGTIWGKGELDRGATFFFTLPPEGTPDLTDED